MTIYEKIAKIQDSLGNIQKDSQNPHFGNSYTSYEGLLKVLTPELRKHNLVLFHTFGEPKFENHLAVTTNIIDTVEGDILTTTLHLPVKKLDPQQGGSAITYAKRYMTLAMFGLGTEDDDGNQSTHTTKDTNLNMGY